MTRALVDPFPADDPLAYDELTPEWQVMRMLLAVLADTGAVVQLPVDLAPSFVPLSVAAGWRLRPDIRPAADGPHLLADAGKVRLSATWVAPPDRSVGYAQCVCQGRAFPHVPGIPGCIAVSVALSCEGCGGRLTGHGIHEVSGTTRCPDNAFQARQGETGGEQ